MDPFSLAVGIAGLAGLDTTTIKYARSYISATKSGKDSIAALITELEALQANLNSLESFLRSASAKDISFQPASVLQSCRTTCEASLKLLCKKLDQVSGSKTSRLLWPLSEKEHQKTMQDLRNFSHWIQFALSIDGCRLLSQTSDDVSKILESQLKGLRALQTLQETASTLNDDVQLHIQVVQGERSERTRDHILSWISTTDHGQKHNSVGLPRVEERGGWLLERPEFLKWESGSAVSNLLWYHGIQGSGKSVLTYVLSDLMEKLDSQGIDQ